MAADEAYSEDATMRASRLDSLAALQDHFQVDGFYKAAQKVGKGLSRLFSRSKSTSNAGAAQFGLEELMLYTNEPIPTSLLKLSGEHVSRAVKMFASVLKYQGDTGEALDDVQRIDIAQKLLHQGLKRPELKDELYMQLVKQTRGNPGPVSREKAWELFNVVASAMPPSKDFVGMISEYIHATVHDEAEAPRVRNLASKAWNALKRSTKAGPRRTLPSTEELDALFSDRRLNTIAFFLDETFEELAYDVTMTVLEAVEQLAGIIKLQNYTTFTLFECRKTLAPRSAMNVEPIQDEHNVLDDNQYIADVLAEFKAVKQSKEGFSSKLLFKKRMFRETDETITEPQFINLSYVQAQHDYLQGHYPVVREDAAQMCALQMQAEHASTLLHDEEALVQSIETFITKQVLMTRPREEWRADVGARYKALEPFSKEDARLQFLRILRSLPYGNSIFFPVKRIDDPIGLLPAKLILGVNKRGVHFFRPVPKEYLHSAELRDIMQFGSSSTAVFFKMRVAGVLHIFQFETKQGEDICMALQTHINDIMMKRYSKAKAMAQGGDGKSGPDGAVAAAGSSGGAPLGLTQANFGAKYEQHVAQLQKALDDTHQRIDQIQRETDSLRYNKEQAETELQEVLDALREEEEQRSALQDQQQALHRELEAIRGETAMARASAAVAAAEEVSVAAGADVGGSAADAARLGELEVELERTTRELEEASSRVAALEKRDMQLQKEKELIEKKMQRIEKAKEQEVAELREKLEASQGAVIEQLKVKDDKIKEVMDELSHINVLYNDTKTELDSCKADQAELEELREMKEDVKRKEKQQQAIIENQGKRLDELEKLYKDEQVTRKRLHNAMEEMKGKIRVLCRVRPMSAAEQSAGEAAAVQVVDELTVACETAAGQPREEIGFDKVLGPTQTTDAAFQDTGLQLKHAIEGFNVYLLTCGQAGSGKSHTLFGSGSETGLVPRCVSELFKVVDKEQRNATFVVTCSMLGLAQDTLVDLLLAPKADAPRLDIKRDSKGAVVVPGATALEVANAKQLTQAIEAGAARAKSVLSDPSTSTLFLTLNIESTNLQTQTVYKGRLTFVELPSSNAQPGASQFKGLEAARAVAAALGSEAASIPYRSHKLTMLLSDALGGNAKTTLWVMLSPAASSLASSQAALQLGVLFKNVKNTASKNELNKDMLKMKKQLEHWQQQAGLSEQQRAMLELSDVTDERAVEE